MMLYFIACFVCGEERRICDDQLVFAVKMDMHSLRTVSPTGSVTYALQL
jgi:hypothetical protein